MSQWNNSYVYNNQYQSSNNWNADMNGQYVRDQRYYARPEGGNEYVSFNDFLSQMRTGNAVAGNATNYNNVQYETYPAQQYSYQNMPSTSQPQLNNYNNYPVPTNMPTEVNTYQLNTPNQYNPPPESNLYTNEMILNSNLTATATEFVPKSFSQPSTSNQNIPEAGIQNVESEAQSSYHKKPGGSSSDRNWRERPQSSQHSQSKEKPVSNGHSNENSKSYNNTRNRDTYRSNEGNNSRHYENKGQETSTREGESIPRNQETNSRNNESSRNDTSNQNQESGSRNYENRSRNYESNSRNQDSHSKNYDNSSRNSGRNYESNRNQEYSRNQDLSNRSQEANSRYEGRNDRRNQTKTNSKFKGKDSDNRTFYNSSIPKDQEARGGRGEGSGRNRNWGGSQRLRGAERNNVEDESYAINYIPQKEEKYERDRERPPRVQNVAPSPKFRNKQGDQVNKEMTQRERLAEQLDKGTLECLVCCDRVRQTDPTWSCGNCYHVLHLQCIKKWAVSSAVEGKWRCPACQNSTDSVPTEYRCMCGAVRAPEYARGGSGAHTCGRACRRPRACPHPCTLLCHPGPCPPCQATVTRQCGCGAESRSILCSSKLAQVCDRQCGRRLECTAHACTRQCHEGPCDTCQETVQQVCHCPAAVQRSVPCSAEAGAAYSCGGACGRVLACGAHVCRAPCHAPPCQPCARAPGAVRTCPCGKMKLEPGARQSCSDAIPVCGSICAKPLPCGPAGDKHFCKMDCHEGACPTCPDKTLVQCRCGHSSREVPCEDLLQMANNVLCQKKCNKKLSCGRHRCRATCCAGGAHRCAVPCGRSLACGAHRCEDFCHTGHCAPCPRVSFSELTCSCGAVVIHPPVRCGTRPPACDAPCRRARPCGHAPHHSCHAGDCPPCVVLTTKRCHGDHEERKTIPCSQEEFSCGLPCGKPLPCGKHTCIKTCHKGPCDTGKCTQPCMEKRQWCGHPCAAPCHSSGGECPSSAPCRRLVRASCPCGRRHAERTCADNARDLAKMMSALAATKMQESGTIDLSEVQRPANMLKTLECDDECRVEARTRQLALALQIRNPDVSAKLAPRYNDNLRATAAREPAFAQQIHDALTDLVQRAKKSKQKTRSHSFPSMNWQKRQFIHELSEHFGCESVAYDAEPNRNVVSTADREKSWLPAMSVLEVLAREAGKRRVPGPVLRAPPPAAARPHAPAAAASKSSGGGWATLTSTNAWAARSQPKPAPTAAPAPAQAPEKAPENKIDYFDNPPDN